MNPIDRVGPVKRQFVPWGHIPDNPRKVRFSPHGAKATRLPRLWGERIFTEVFSKRTVQQHSVVTCTYRLPTFSSPQETVILSLNRADAKKTAAKVASLYQDLSERGRMSDAPLILPVEWSNSILAAGTPDQFQTFRSLIRGLDHIAVYLSMGSCLKPV